MSNTYYDSSLTGEQIEAALEAISGVISASNNNKVLAISNGKIVARDVQWGGDTPTIEELSVTKNGTYTAPSGVDGYSPVTVDVEPTLQEKTVTENGSVTADEGYDGLSKVTVNVETGGTIEALEITENGTYTASGDVDGYSPITVNVPSDAKIYYVYDPDYCVTDAGTLLCDIPYNGYYRSYTKTISGLAYVAYYCSGSYTGPILVSTDEGAVQYSCDAGTSTTGGTVTYNGKPYYYSGAGMFQPGDATSIAGVAKKLTGTYSTAESAALALLELAVKPFEATANGSYAVPDEYDGYGNFEVNVPATTTSLIVTENGLYTPESGVDGFSSVVVNVSGGGGSDDWVTWFDNGTLFNTDIFGTPIFRCNSSAVQNADTYQTDGYIQVSDSTTAYHDGEIITSAVMDCSKYIAVEYTLITGEYSLPIYSYELTDSGSYHNIYANFPNGATTYIKYDNVPTNVLTTIRYPFPNINKNLYIWGCANIKIYKIRFLPA